MGSFGDYFKLFITACHFNRLDEGFARIVTRLNDGAREGGWHLNR